jgi:hypothetical protein
MAILQVGLAVPDLQEPRGIPCSAVTGLNITCGATPSSRYVRACGIESHQDDINLCPIHAAIAACGGALCRLCVIRGGIVAVRVFRISYAPLRIGPGVKGGIIRGR